MKKSKILFLIMAFALTFMVAINVKAAGTNCTDVVTGGKYNWTTSGGRFVSGAGATTGEPSCAEQGTTYWQTTRANITGSECAAEGVTEPCHMDRQWVRQPIEDPDPPTPQKVNPTLTVPGSVSVTKPNTVTISVTQSGCASVTFAAHGNITVSGSGVVGTSNVASSSEVNSVTVTCHGDSGHYDATKTVTVNVTVPQTSDEIHHVTASSSSKELGEGETGEVTFSAQNSDNQALTVNWSVSGDTDWIASNGCTGSKKNCSITFKGKECVKNKSVTVTGTDSHGTSKSATVTLNSSKYTSWSSNLGPIDLPAGTTVYTRETAKDHDVCDAYEGSSVNSDGSIHFTAHYNRCCGGGGGQPETACYEKPDGTREVTTYKSGYVKKDDKYCEKACYKKTDNTYENTWYEDNYEKVEDRFCEDTPQPHCYKKEDGTYVNEVYQEGYVQVDDKFCETACYKKEDGTVAKTTYQEGYVKLDDKYCEKACYKTGENKYENTYYQDGYEKVDDDKCVDAPPTAATVSKIIYALSLFLVMAGSGIIVYQLTKTKKELG